MSNHSPHHHIWRIEGLDCPNCARQLENEIRSHVGVQSVELDFMGGILRVLCSMEQDCRQAFEAIGARHGASLHDVEASESAVPAPERSKIPAEALHMAFSGLFLLIGWATGVGVWYLVSLVIAGSPVIIRAFQELKLRTMGMNTLMIVAAIGAVAIGEWQEGAMVLFLFTIARWLERLNSEKARRSIELLKTEIPALAHIIDEHGDYDLPVARVETGTLIRVKPNERIPLDGLVISGCSSCDESILTGESRRATKNPGSEVFAGTFNGEGALEVETSQEADQSRFSRIIDSVERIQGQKTRFQSVVERFAEIYTPLVVLLALLIGFLPPVLTGQPFLPWIHSALVLLVVACPCALVLAAPVTQVASITLAARSGILFRSGDMLESAAEIQVVAFDKTGTITRGEPHIQSILPEPGQDSGRILEIAAALELNSEHPLGRAFASARPSTQPLLPVTRFSVFPGRGIEGTIEEITYRLGLEHWAMEILTSGNPATHAPSDHLATMTLASSQEVLGRIAIDDLLRPEAGEVIQQLKHMGIRHTALLSGDHPDLVKEYGSRLGISESRGRCYPEDKQKRLGELQQEYGPVLMLGDGINDAPALAAAHLGVAMGKRGTDAVLETAGAVLLHDDLGRLPLLLSIGRRNQSLIKTNMALALGLKLLVFGLSLAGWATLWMAVIADTGASVLVVMNSLRALQPPPTV